MEAFKVLTPGAFTTVQDLGRFGYQRMGIPISGALDRFACQIANLLVGNLPGAAVLEITVIGPRLEFLNETHISTDRRTNRHDSERRTGFRLAINPHRSG